MKNSIKMITEKLYNGSQSILFEGIYKVSVENVTHKIRVLIKRDSYDMQSHAKAQFWSGSEWNHIVSLEWDKTKSKELFCYKKVDEFTESEKIRIMADKKELIELTKEIIF